MNRLLIASWTAASAVTLGSLAVSGAGAAAGHARPAGAGRLTAGLAPHAAAASTTTTTVARAPSAALAVPAGAGAGSSSGTFTLAVEADGIGISVLDNNLPLSQNIFTSPYSALANLDSIGDSSASAAAPDLGPTVQPLIGTLNGAAAGSIPPLPTPPGLVTASYPSSPTAAQTNGPYSISATSSLQESKSAVRLGTTQAGDRNATAFATADALANPDGSTVSTGTAGADALDFGGILDLGNLTSTVTLTQSPSQPPKVTTHTNLGTITVLGLPVGLTESGLSVLGANVPLAPEVLNQALDHALFAAGLSIRYLPATTTNAPGTNVVQSVTSGAVEVSITHDVPTQGLVTLDLVLGRVTIAATNTGAARGPATDTYATGSTPADTTGGLPTGASPSSTGTLSTPTPADSASARAAPSSGTSGSPPAPSATPSASPGPAASSPTRQRALGVTRPLSSRDGGSSTGPYLILVLAACAAIAGAQVIRLLGIRVL